MLEIPKKGSVEYRNKCKLHFNSNLFTLLIFPDKDYCIYRFSDVDIENNLPGTVIFSVYVV